MGGQGTLHDPHYWRGVQKCANKGGAFCSWGAGLALSLEPSLTTLGFCQWGRFPDLVLYQMASVSA